MSPLSWGRRGRDSRDSPAAPDQPAEDQPARVRVVASPFMAASVGGPIRCVVLDYGGTLDVGGDYSAELGMRLASPLARNVVPELTGGLGVRLVLASNTEPGQDRCRALEASGITEHFAVVVQSHQERVAKPSPAFARIVQDADGWAADEVLVVSTDLVNDVLPAVEVGMPAALIQAWPWRRGAPPGTVRISDLAALPILLREGVSSD